MNHVKTSAQSHDDFILGFVGMATPLLTTRYIVCPEHPLNLERYLVGVLDKGKIPSRIKYFGEIDEFAVFHLSGMLGLKMHHFAVLGFKMNAVPPGSKINLTDNRIIPDWVLFESFHNSGNIQVAVRFE